MIDPIQSYEDPKEYTIKNVTYWEPSSKALMIAKGSGDKHASPLLTKAKKFLIEGCIEQVNNTTWLCMPLINYNKTTYFIRSIKGGFTCNCQGFNKKYTEFETGNSDITPICSHILAVKQYCFIGVRNAS
jgi:hypothetical protein